MKNRYHIFHMKMSSNTALILFAVAVVGVLMGALLWKKYGPSVYDEFAQCLTDKGVVMKGAYWCSHCADQKKAFGSAFRKIHYVECSSPGSTTFDLCPDVTTSPLWVAADGTEYPGFRTLENLSDTFACSLPASE